MKSNSELTRDLVKLRSTISTLKTRKNELLQTKIESSYFTQLRFTEMGEELEKIHKEMDEICRDIRKVRKLFGVTIFKKKSAEGSGNKEENIEKEGGKKNGNEFREKCQNSERKQENVARNIAEIITKRRFKDVKTTETQNSYKTDEKNKTKEMAGLKKKGDKTEEKPKENERKRVKFDLVDQTRIIPIEKTVKKPQKTTKNTKKIVFDSKNEKNNRSRVAKGKILNSEKQLTKTNEKIPPNKKATKIEKQENPNEKAVKIEKPKKLQKPTAVSPQNRSSLSILPKKKTARRVLKEKQQK